MKTLTKEELIKKLSEFKTASFVSVIYETAPKSRTFKTRIKKQQQITAQIGFVYTNAVNNRREKENKETDFVAFPRKWGERKGVFVEWKNKLYLETRILHSQVPLFFIDGKLASGIIEEEIRKDLIDPYDNSKHQGVSQEIKLRDISIENIRAITMSGDTFVISR